MVNAFALGQIKVHTLVKTVGPVGLMKCEFQRLTQAVNLFTLFSSSKDLREIDPCDIYRIFIDPIQEISRLVKR